MRAVVWACVIGSCAFAGAVTSPIITLALLPFAIITMLRPAKKRR